MSSVSSALAVIGEVLGGVGGIGALGYTVRRGAKDKTHEAAKDRADYGKEQFQAGCDSRDDEMALMRSQRDDARRERDDNAKWEDRYIALRDRGVRYD